MRKIALVIAYLFASFFSFGQIDSADVNLSPYGVIYNHLYSLQDDSYDPSKAAISFPDNIENRNELAIQLIRILDGKGIYVDINRLPTETDYRDSLSQEATYFIDKDEPRIYLELQNGKWYYSRTTIAFIPEMFQEVFPFGTSFAQFFHGPFWNFTILGIAISKWLGLLLLLVFCGLLFYLVNFISRRFISIFLQQKLGVPEKVKDDVNKVARVFALFFTTKIVLYFLPMFQLPIRLNSFLLKGLGVLSIFFVILLIARMANIVIHYLDDVTQKTKNTLDDQLLPVLSKIVKLIIWAIGILYILEFLDVNVTALLAGISIGGLAIALAAQDTVKNFFGSIMIFLDRPFQIGDWINFDNVDGTVEEVGVRSTRIRTFANSVVYVPNGMLADKVVNNMGLRQFRRFKTELGVTYNTSPKKIDLFVKGVREIIKRHPTTRKDYFEVHLNSFGASSINILLYCFFEAKDWTAELKGRHDIMYAILLLADELGVSFAFPSQSIYIESMAAASEGKVANMEKQLDSSMAKVDDYFRNKLDTGNGNKINPLGGE